MVDKELLCRDISSLGFCALPRFLSSETANVVAMHMDEYWQREGHPSLSGRGLGIHPVAKKLPKLAVQFQSSELYALVQRLLSGPISLKRIGGRITDEFSNQELAPWHNHYHWNPARLQARRSIDRVLAVIYVDGSTTDSGNLFVRERTLNAPLGPPPTSISDSQVHRVTVERGGLVIFDTATWHCAQRGERPGRRRIVGAHFQTAHLAWQHPDDDVPDNTTLASQSPGRSGATW